MDFVTVVAIVVASLSSGWLLRDHLVIHIKNADQLPPVDQIKFVRNGQIFATVMATLLAYEDDVNKAHELRNTLSRLFKKVMDDNFKAMGQELDKNIQ